MLGMNLTHVSKRVPDPCHDQDSKVHGANMGPTCVLSAPDGPHIGPMNLAIREKWYNIGIRLVKYHFEYTVLKIHRESKSWPFNPWFNYIKYSGARHDDVIKWKHFPRNWPFVWGIHRSHKGQWRGALMFTLICVWINGWVNNREAGELRRHRGHYDVNVMRSPFHSLREDQPSDASIHQGHIY